MWQLRCVLYLHSSSYLFSRHAGVHDLVHVDAFFWNLNREWSVRLMSTLSGNTFSLVLLTNQPKKSSKEVKGQLDPPWTQSMIPSGIWRQKWECWDGLAVNLLPWLQTPSRKLVRSASVWDTRPCPGWAWLGRSWRAGWARGTSYWRRAAACQNGQAAPHMVFIPAVTLTSVTHVLVTSYGAGKFFHVIMTYVRGIMWCENKDVNMFYCLQM